MDSNVYNPAIPFCESLPQHLQLGSLLRITGTVSSSATCFSINLQNGSNSYQRSDISLHLSPVFSSPPRVVRNSLENQQWGPEESHGPQFPFVVDQRFEILILAESDHFKIAVNGQHFTEFQYRLPLQNITHIAIDGDVTIDCIKFEGLAASQMAGSGEGVSKPLGFVIDPSSQGNLAIPPSGGRPSSPYDASSLPYPTNFGPSPTSFTPPTSSGNYNQNSPSSPYGPSGYPPYGPPPIGGSSYGPPPSGGSPYGPPPSGGSP
ncbi:galectin-4, partial [Nephila pilipes]